MGEGVIIRPAEEQDAQEICAVLKESIKTLCVGDHNNDPAILARWAESKTPELLAAWINDPNTMMFVAVQGGRIISVGSVSCAGEIHLNYIHPSARFHGISRQMMARLEAAAAASGARVCTLSSTGTARRFYASLGYQETENAQGLFGPTVFQMIKKID